MTPCEQIIIIGVGPLACDCVAVARRTTPSVSCIEPEGQSVSRLPALCRKLGVEYRSETDRASLQRYFEKIRTPTLVVSAYNKFIFPVTVIENPYLLLVNFHNSLLPRHPGRNAPTWAIFEEDAETGVTWHLVQAAVDGGDVVLQRPLVIPPLATAIELTRQTLVLGAETFEELLPRLWSGDYQALPQPRQARRALNKSTDIPNGGVLDLSWGPRRISALLRSVDYGGLPVFPPLRVTLRETDYRVARYHVSADPAASPRTMVEPPRVEIQGDGLVIGLVLASDDGELSMKRIGEDR